MAIVTGSGSGIGQVVAEGLSQAGADVVVTELPNRREAAEETAKKVREAGRRSLVVALDVTSLQSITSMVREVCAQFGGIDVLVNNAGIIVRKNSFEVTEHEWDSVMDTNLKGAFFTSQAAAKVMARLGGGRIINVASINGVLGSPERASYTSSKAGLINLTRTLAVEWAQYGITVNAIGPSYLSTPLTEPIFEDQEFRDYCLRRQPVKRIGRPEDLLGAFVYLASPASAFVTGHTLMVDGGWTAV